MAKKNRSSKRGAELADESYHDIKPTKLQAYGITLEARGGRAKAMIEMLEFAHMVAWDGCSSFVKEVIYEDLEGCTITLVDTVQKDDPETEGTLETIRDCARRTLAAYSLFGVIEFGEVTTS